MSERLSRGDTEPAREERNASVLTTRLPRRASEPLARPAESGQGAATRQEAMLTQMRALPALPNAVLRVLRFSRREDASARAMAQILAQDVALTTRVLTLANSAYYGLPRAVGTLTDAVVLLGSHSIRHVALVASTHETLQRKVGGYGLGAGELWQHSLACGEAAQMLAEVTGYGEPEEAFVAGLLHDIGKLILNEAMQEAQVEIQEALVRTGGDLAQAEREVLGLDHAEAGGRLATRWNLPSSLVQAIRQHHAEPSGSNDPVARLTALVRTANALCWKMGAGCGYAESSACLTPEDLRTLALDAPRLESVAQKLRAHLAQISALAESLNTDASEAEAKRGS